MFEREITDSMFLQRWSIVRTLMPQSVAEHTFAVAHYANDICVFLGLPHLLHLSVLQYSLWHDSRDEIFTSDLPGPSKRGLLDAIGPEAKDKWDAKLEEWSQQTFTALDRRSGLVAYGGMALPPEAVKTVKLVVKTADWLEASVRMATEAQMGNGCTVRHIVPNMNGAIETARDLIYNITGDRPADFPDDPQDAEPRNAADDYYWQLAGEIRACVELAHKGQSRGPWITKEDDSRNPQITIQTL